MLQLGKGDPRPNWADPGEPVVHGQLTSPSPAGRPPSAKCSFWVLVALGSLLCPFTKGGAMAKQG